MSVAFYKKPLTFSLKKRTKTYTRFSARDRLEYPLTALRVNGRKNCAIEDGILRAGLGLKPFVLANGTAVYNPVQSAIPQTFFTFINGANEETLSCLTKTGDWYIYSEGKWALRKQFGKPMHAFVVPNTSKGDVVVFAGEAGYTTYSGASKILTNRLLSPFLPVGCSAQGRVFCAAEFNEVAYFAAFDVSKTTQDNENVGRIRLPESAGKILSMVGLSDCVVVFCTYGIFTIKVYGNGNDFVVEKILFDGGMIFGNSVCLMKEQGNTIAFLTERGVYVLHGTSVKKLGLDIEIMPKDKGQVCNQGLADGKYVLTYVDEIAGERCVVIDVERESGYACFLPSTFCNVNGYAACLQGTSIQLFAKDGDFPAGERAQVQLCFERNALEKETLKKLALFGKGEVSVRVKADCSEREFAMDLTAGKAIATINVRAEDFDVVCTMPAKSMIQACSVTFYQTKEGALGVKK